ncbi:MAG: LLM class flavin-dependent oxidoreductase [Thaumarchaeota archaeon]|nr:LLM class flavin-dependent oxidoreductase [Nitrososphaerota archaeon]
MDFGVSISWRGTTIESTRAVCLEADRLGFDYLWITEAWGLEALATAGYLLGLSNHIKIGAGVLNVYSRSAALIGMACATLEQLAPGRFLLGVGTSGRKLVERWHGVRFDRPIERMREYVEVIKKVVQGETVEFSGESLNLSGFKLYTQPRKTPQEIFVGAMGERSLRLSGAISDGALVTMYPIFKLADALKLVNHGDPSGNPKKLFAYLQLRIAEGDEELEKAKREVARNIAFYITSMGEYYARNMIRFGFGRDVKRIIDAHSSGGSKQATEAVEDHLIDELSLVGTAEEIREKILRIPKDVTPVFVLDAPPELKVSDLKLDQLKPLL